MRQRVIHEEAGLWKFGIIRPKEVHTGCEVIIVTLNDDKYVDANAGGRSKFSNEANTLA